MSHNKTIPVKVHIGPLASRTKGLKKCAPGKGKGKLTVKEIKSALRAREIPFKEYYSKPQLCALLEGRPLVRKAKRKRKSPPNKPLNSIDKTSEKAIKKVISVVESVGKGVQQVVNKIVPRKIVPRKIVPRKISPKKGEQKNEPRKIVPRKIVPKVVGAVGSVAETAINPFKQAYNKAIPKAIPKKKKAKNNRPVSPKKVDKKGNAKKQTLAEIKAMLKTKGIPFKAKYKKARLLAILEGKDEASPPRKRGRNPNLNDSTTQTPPVYKHIYAGLDEIFNYYVEHKSYTDEYMKEDIVALHIDGDVTMMISMMTEFAKNKLKLKLTAAMDWVNDLYRFYYLPAIRAKPGKHDIAIKNIANDLMKANPRMTKKKAIKKAKKKIFGAAPKVPEKAFELNRKK
jgi:hypothetical protein